MLAHTHTHTHTHTDTRTQGAMLSPNVINAVKRLTSGYLFKSRHQTHSFFFFISIDHRSYCQGRKAPSDHLSVQRGRPNKARAFSTTLSLSFIIYRGSVPRPHRPPREQGRSLSGGQWTVELEVAVDSLWRMMSPTSDPDTARRQAEGQLVKSEGGRQNGNSDTGRWGRGAGGREWRVCFCVFMVQLKEIHTLICIQSCIETEGMKEIQTRQKMSFWTTAERWCHLMKQSCDLWTLHNLAHSLSAQPWM